VSGNIRETFCTDGCMMVCGSTINLPAFSLFGTQLETESLLGGRYLHICVVIEGFIDYQHEMLKL
jgi:hypothetical protein